MSFQIELLDKPHIMLDHDFDQILERSLAWVPAEEGLGLGGVAEQLLHFGGAEIARVDLDEHFSGGRVDALLVDAFAFPAQLDADMMEGQGAELADGVVLARSDDEVLRLLLLQDEPHALHVVLGVAPVAEGVEVAEVELVLVPLLDAGGGEGDLAGDEGLAAAFALVVEEDAVGGKHAVALAVVLHDPEAVLLGHAVGRARVKRRRLLLRHLLHLAEELGGGGLVDAAFVLQPEDAHGLEETQGADGIGLGGVFRAVERHLHVALGGEVIDLVGLHLLDDAHQRRRVGHVAVMQGEQALVLHVAHPFVEVEVLDAARVERRRAADDAVHVVAFLQKELCEEGAVLARDAG